MPRSTKKRSPKLINEIYRRLLLRFGKQGWWPTTSREKPFEICLGTILTQNTSWTNVSTVLLGLKRTGLLSFSALLKQPQKRLENLLHSSGYFRQKAKRVKLFLKDVQRSTRGNFTRYLNGPLPALRVKLLSLHGVGPETADSMLLYAGAKPIFVVDAYTRRIGQRLGILEGDESYDEIQSIFMSALPKSTVLYKEYHALLVKLAKKHCQTKPKCDGCPVHALCIHRIAA